MTTKIKVASNEKWKNLLTHKVNLAAEQYASSVEHRVVNVFKRNE